jgi:glycosyltransferase involved in cell wall biosynthesis
MPDSIHIIGSRASGGAERFYARLINSLSGQSRVLAVNRAGSAVSKMVDPQVPQIHLPMFSNQDFLSRFVIGRIAAKQRPAIIQTYMGRATRLTHIARNRGLVHIARLGGYYNLKAYRHAHHLIGNTKGICDYLIQQGVPADTVHYIGNFVDLIAPPSANELVRLRESLRLPDDAFIITCAARFHGNKGLHDLLNAFRLVRAKHPQARLILVGGGPLADELNHQIQMLDLTNSVTLPGWCDPHPYYHLADVITCPSRHEPLGNTILEAWACEKPIVATATQGAEELIVPEENGLIVPVQDADKLAQAFERLIRDAALCKSLAQSGSRVVQTTFSREIITGAYRNLYSRLLSKL